MAKRTRTQVFIAILACICMANFAFADSLSDQTLRLATQRKVQKTQTEPTNPYIESIRTAQPAVAVAQPKPQQQKPARAPQPQAITTDDTLLNILPADCLMCLRINNFNNSLSMLDQYLMGLSPMPLGQLARQQLGALIGTPMLQGVDMNGNFAVIVDQNDQMGLLIPVTSYDKYLGAVKQVSETDANGVTQIESISMPDEPTFVTHVPDTRFALVAGTEKQVIMDLAKSLKTNPLATAVTAEQRKTATSKNAWFYVNMQATNKIAGPMLEGLKQKALADVQKETAGAGQMQPDKMVELYFTMFQTLLEQSKDLSIALEFTPDILKKHVNYSALPGSEVAQMLTPLSNNGQGFETLKYIPEDMALIAAAKYNPQTYEKVNSKFLDIVVEKFFADDTKLKEKIKQLVEKASASVGTEMSFGFSYAAAPTAFNIVEVVKGGDLQKTKEILPPAYDLVNDIYNQMGIPLGIKTTQTNAVEKYRDIAIDEIDLKFEFDESQMPADQGVSPQQMLETIYGEGLTMLLASVGNDLLVANTMPHMKQLIDKALDNGGLTVPSSITFAYDNIDGAQSADFVGSINFVRLIKGMGEMLQSMQATLGPAAGVGTVFVDSFNIPTSSSIAMAGSTGDGTFEITAAIPKQHLMEVMAGVMQFQQKMMEQMQQQMQNMEGMNGDPFEMEGQSKAQPDMMQEDTVMVMILGDVTDAQKDEIAAELKKMLADQDYHSINSMPMEGGAAFRVSPVTDVKAFADKITFGEVTNAQANLIMVKLKD